MSCSCPDSAYMCKHIAAVLYGVGASLDSRPDWLFVLRHVDHIDLISVRDQAFQPAQAAENALQEGDLSVLFGIEMESVPVALAANKGKPAATKAVKAGTTAKPKVTKTKAGAAVAKPKVDKAGTKVAKLEAAKAKIGVKTKVASAQTLAKPKVGPKAKVAKAKAMGKSKVGVKKLAKVRA